MKKINPVAKHQHKFNKAVVMQDKKQAQKRGYEKYKRSYLKANKNNQWTYLINLTLQVA